MNNLKTKLIIILILTFTLTGMLIDIILMNMLTGKDKEPPMESTDICVRLHMKESSELPAIELESKQV